MDEMTEFEKDVKEAGTLGTIEKATQFLIDKGYRKHPQGLKAVLCPYCHTYETKKITTDPDGIAWKCLNSRCRKVFDGEFAQPSADELVEALESAVNILDSEGYETKYYHDVLTKHGKGGKG